MLKLYIGYNGTFTFLYVPLCSLVATNTAGIQLAGPKPKYWSDTGTR